MNYKVRRRVRRFQKIRNRITGFAIEFMTAAITLGALLGAPIAFILIGGTLI